MMSRCPQCQTDVEVVEFDPLIEVQCPQCGHWFGVAGEFSERELAMERTVGVPDRMAGQRFNEIVVAFRSALLDDIPAELSDWLQRVEPQDRADLLPLLLEVDSEVRLSRGERPNKSTHLLQLPDYETIVEEFWKDETAAFLTRDEDSAVTVESCAMESGGENAATKRVKSLPTGYEYVRDLGQGGFGVVVLARDAKLGRLVALKFMKADNAQRNRRFEAEARVMAQFKNPNVLQIHDYGQWGESLYLALEYVEGGTLAERLDGTPLAERQAAVLVETLARAVGEVHEHNVVHRDLKPANVLVVEDHGVPLESCTLKIADFGLAKAPVSDSDMTQAGIVMGTPSYMAPEQARGQAVDATAQTDVYSLGVVLYEMLTGRCPFRAATPIETCHQVIHDEPVSPKQLLQRLSADLDTICLKCLNKDPRKRYDNANELAADLACYLEGRPIRARKSTALERGIRLCRRNLLTSSLVALLMTALVGGLIISALLWQNAEKRRNKLRRLLYSSESNEQITAMLAGDFQRVESWLDTPTVRSDDIRGFEWGLLDAFRNERFATVAYEHRLDTIAFSPTDDIAVAAGADRGFQIMRGPEYRESKRYFVKNQAGYPAHYYDSAFSPDGKTLWVLARQTTEQDGTRSQGNSVRAIDTKTWTERRRWSVRGSKLALSADGKWLATSLGGRTQVWNLKSRKDVALNWPDEVHALLGDSGYAAFSPTNLELAVCSSLEDGKSSTLLIDVKSGEMRLQIRHQAALGKLRWSPDGRTLGILKAGDAVVHLYDAGTGEEFAAFAEGTFVLDLEFSKTGDLLFTLHDQNELRVWRIADRALLRVVSGSGGIRIALSPDGETLGVAGKYGLVQFLKAESTPDRLTLAHDEPEFYSETFKMWSVASAANMVVTVHDRKLHFWDLETAAITKVVTLSGERIKKVLASADATVVACQLDNHRVAVWDAKRGLSPVIEGAGLLRISDDGTRLLLAPHSEKMSFGVWDVRTGKYLFQKRYDGAVHGVDCSADGTHVAIVLRDGTVHRWTMKQTPTELPAFRFDHRAAWPRHHDVVVSADGSLICAATGNRHFEVWDFKRAKRILTGRESTGVFSVDLAADKRTLAVGRGLGRVSLWNLPTKRRVGILRYGDGRNWTVDFAANDDSLVATDDEGQVRIWHAKKN